MEFQLIPFVLTKVFHTSNSMRGHAKDTVIPVEIEGAPTDEETDDVEVPPQPASKPKTKKSKVNHR